jgi:hypothetical protein
MPCFALLCHTLPCLASPYLAFCLAFSGVIVGWLTLLYVILVFDFVLSCLF